MELAESLAPTRADVVLGHSAGAMLALACELPEPPRAVVLIEPVARQLIADLGGNHEPGLLLGEPDSARSTNAVSLYPRADASTLAYIEAADDTPASRADAAGQARWEDRRRRLSEQLAALENLVIVRGVRSAFCTEASASRIAVRAKNCRGVLIIPECGHSPHVESPRLTADALRSAVDQATTS